MALRSVLCKMSGLRVRSPETGLPGRALSPAAGSRLLSDGAPIHDLEKVMDYCRREVALSSAAIDDTMRRIEQDHRSMMAKLDKMDKAASAVIIACPVAIALMIIMF